MMTISEIKNKIKKMWHDHLNRDILYILYAKSPIDDYGICGLLRDNIFTRMTDEDAELRISRFRSSYHTEKKTTEDHKIRILVDFVCTAHMQSIMSTGKIAPKQSSDYELMNSVMAMKEAMNIHNSFKFTDAVEDKINFLIDSVCKEDKILFVKFFSGKLKDDLDRIGFDVYTVRRIIEKPVSTVHVI